MQERNARLPREVLGRAKRTVPSLEKGGVRKAGGLATVPQSQHHVETKSNMQALYVEHSLILE